MRTLAEALAEGEFYARSTATAAPEGPSRREKGRRRAGERLAVLSGFEPVRRGQGAILRASVPADHVQVYDYQATSASMLQEAAR